MFAEALSQSTFGGFVITVLVHTDMASPHLHHAGTPAQKARYMPGVTAGDDDHRGGDHRAGRRLRRRRHPHDGEALADGSEWILNGTKLFITNGVHADLYFVAAKTGEGRHAMSMFIVEKGTPGFRVGRALDKAGWLSSDTAELVFEDCRIPAANLLGEEDRGFYSVMKNFQTERIALGGDGGRPLHAGAALTLEHVRDRQAFGASAVRQAGGAPAPGDARRQDARRARLHVPLRLAGDAGPGRGAGGLDAEGADRRAGQRGGAGCQQFHGGMGYMRDTPIERLWRDARVLAIGGGATEVMLDEVAKRY